VSCALEPQSTRGHARKPNKRLSQTTTVNTAEDIVYDAYGTMAEQTASYKGSPILDILYSSGTNPAAQRDVFGRISKKTETTTSCGTTTTRALAYTYDGLGQLIDVTQDGTSIEHYTYDPNGNRLTELGATTSATYDAQDRLLSYNQASGTAWTFTYNDDGTLKTATSTPGGTTNYVYDELSHLTQVTLPDGKVIDYVIDSRGRRIAKKVNGVVTKQWIYDGQLRIAAELSGTTLNRFVCGSRTKTSATKIRNRERARRTARACLWLCGWS